MTEERHPRTAVLAGPHPLWLGAVRRVLVDNGVEVRAATTSADEVVSLLDAHRPDLLLADIAPGDSPGLALIRSARRQRPDVRVIAFSSSNEPGDVQRALGAGAVAYVLETALPDDIAFAIRHAFSPAIYLAGTRGTPSPETESEDVAQLTKRELEILRLVAEGKSNVQLAKKLWVTEQTVKFHLSNIYRKLGVANRTEASRWAQRRGLLRDPDQETERRRFEERGR